MAENKQTPAQRRAHARKLAKRRANDEPRSRHWKISVPVPGHDRWISRRIEAYNHDTEFFSKWIRRECTEGWLEPNIDYEDMGLYHVAIVCLNKRHSKTWLHQQLGDDAHVRRSESLIRRARYEMCNNTTRWRTYNVRRLRAAQIPGYQTWYKPDGSTPW